MISYAAQEYMSDILDVYLEDGNTVFKMKDIGFNPDIWKELEDAGMIKLFPHLGLGEVDLDAVDKYAYPDDVYK